MNRLLVILALLTLPAISLADPGKHVLQAAADIQRVPVELRHYIRYLDLPDGEKDRKILLDALAFQCNSLSREIDIIPLQVVGDLVRLNTKDFEYNLDVWEKFSGLDSYYHTQLVKVDVIVPVVEEVTIEGIEFYREGGDNALILINRSDVQSGETLFVRRRRGESLQRVTMPAGRKAQQVKQAEKGFAAHAPWLPTEAIASLSLATKSDAPIVRADWFIWQTGAQFKRGGAGYYDFLGFKKREDIEKFTALDIAAAKRVRKEIAAIVSESGVAVNNRQVIRYQTLTGGYWATLDVEDNEGNHNAVEVLDGDFKHQAEEIYAPHMNGLFVYGASDADGTLQEKVPVKFAGDDKNTNKSVEIEPMFSCVRCHTEGLRPIDDWARKTFTGPVKLASYDYEKYKRLKRLYLSDLPGQLKIDQEAYARALKKVNGLTPEANARNYANQWRKYADTSLGLEETAVELGVDVKVWKEALVKYSSGKLVNPLLAGLLADPPARIRREHWVAKYALAQEVVLPFRKVKP